MDDFQDSAEMINSFTESISISVNFACATYPDRVSCVVKKNKLSDLFASGANINDDENDEDRVDGEGVTGTVLSGSKLDQFLPQIQVKSVAGCLENNDGLLGAETTDANNNIALASTLSETKDFPSQVNANKLGPSKFKIPKLKSVEDKSNVTAGKQIIQKKTAIASAMKQRGTPMPKTKSTVGLAVRHSKKKKHEKKEPRQRDTNRDKDATWRHQMQQVEKELYEHDVRDAHRKQWVVELSQLSDDVIAGSTKMPIVCDSSAPQSTIKQEGIESSQPVKASLVKLTDVQSKSDFGGLFHVAQCVSKQRKHADRALSVGSKTKVDSKPPVSSASVSLSIPKHDSSKLSQKPELGSLEDLKLKAVIQSSFKSSVEGPAKLRNETCERTVEANSMKCSATTAAIETLKSKDNEPKLKKPIEKRISFEEYTCKHSLDSQPQAGVARSLSDASPSKSAVVALNYESDIEQYLLQTSQRHKQLTASTSTLTSSSAVNETSSSSTVALEMVGCSEKAQTAASLSSDISTHAAAVTSVQDVLGSVLPCKLTSAGLVSQAMGHVEECSTSSHLSTITSHLSTATTSHLSNHLSTATTSLLSSHLSTATTSYLSNHLSTATTSHLPTPTASNLSSHLSTATTSRPSTPAVELVTPSRGLLGDFPRRVLIRDSPALLGDSPTASHLSTATTSHLSSRLSTPTSHPPTPAVELVMPSRGLLGDFPMAVLIRDSPALLGDSPPCSAVASSTQLPTRKGLLGDSPADITVQMSSAVKLSSSSGHNSFPSLHDLGDAARSRFADFGPAVSGHSSAELDPIVKRPSADLDPRVRRPSADIDPSVRCPLADLDPIVKRPSADLDLSVRRPSADLDPIVKLPLADLDSLGYRTCFSVRRVSNDADRRSSSPANRQVMSSSLDSPQLDLHLGSDDLVPPLPATDPLEPIPVLSPPPLPPPCLLQYEYLNFDNCAVYNSIDTDTVVADNYSVVDMDTDSISLSDTESLEHSGIICSSGKSITGDVAASRLATPVSWMMHSLHPSMISSRLYNPQPSRHFYGRRLVYNNSGIRLEPRIIPLESSGYSPSDRRVVRR